MKPGTLITRIIVCVLAVGIAAYMGVQVWRVLSAQMTTATIYSYTAEERVESVGYFFRTEQVLEDASPLAELLVSEGERVGAGDRVARIYHSEEGYALQKELEDESSRLESLTYILNRVSVSADAVALDAEIVESFTSVSASVAAGDFSALSQETTQLRALMFRRDYTYSGTAELQTEIENTKANIESLKGQMSQAYDAVLTPVSGIFSAAVDGYEGVLTPESLFGITPSGLTALAGGRQETAENCVGKIITDNTWYFACNISEEDAKNLYAGEDAQLRFGDSSRLFDVQVRSLSGAENGLVTVVFESDAYLSQCSWLRNQTVDIITGSNSGLRVPKQALRVAEDGTLGVYRVAGAQLEWVTVEVLWEDEDYYLVAEPTPLDDEGNPKEQTAMEEAKRLRPGDEVAVKGTGLYDGKVVIDE